MRDGLVRRSLKRVARARYVFDLAFHRRRLKRKTVWFDLGGECRRCARCCEAPSIAAHPAVWHLRSLRALFLWWQRAVNGFALVEADARARVFVFRCTHFDEATRLCDSYDSRPGMCRDYPRALLFQPQPELLPGCGYRAVAPNAGRLRRALEQYPLTEEQKARLQRGLKLE